MLRRIASVAILLASLSASADARSDLARRDASLEPRTARARRWSSPTTSITTQAIEAAAAGGRRRARRSGAARTLASVLWLNMLFSAARSRSITTSDRSAAPSVDLRKPPPELDAEFKQHVAEAIELAQKRVERSATRPAGALRPRSGARPRGVLHRNGRRADARRLPGGAPVLRRARAGARARRVKRNDAGLVVGTYRYLVSTLSLPMRMMAYVAGFGGGKERASSCCEQAAAGRRRSANRCHVRARIACTTASGDSTRRCGCCEQLRGLYPRNRLVLLEAGRRRCAAAGPRRPRRCSPKDWRCSRAKRGRAFPARSSSGATSAARRGPRCGRAETRSTISARRRRPRRQAWVAGRARVETRPPGAEARRPRPRPPRGAPGRNALRERKRSDLRRGGPASWLRDANGR